MTSKAASVLIVDDEAVLGSLLSRLMKMEGYDAQVASDGLDAMEQMRQRLPDVVLTDIRMPNMDGMEFLKRAKMLDPDLPVILLTGYADIHGAVDAMRAGAHDYISKPFDHHEVIRVVRRALKERFLKNKLKQITSTLDEPICLGKLMGPSEQVTALITTVNRVAKSDFSVIIQGETGSGKELVAKAIHQAGNRSNGPFVALDCGAIPETLLESELFGHEKGAFTGAVKQKKGKFEIARRGTLFLDEMFNMSMESQAKLLRALQERQIYRVGSLAPIAVDVRIVTATNRNLESCSPASFRKDLFFRLNEVTIRVPALRERPRDIPYLCRRFLDLTNLMLQKNVAGFSEGAMSRLMAYPWPGNVRELKSTIKRAVLMADDEIRQSHLGLSPHAMADVAPDPSVSPEKTKGRECQWEGRSLKEMVKAQTMALERRILCDVLRQTGGNKAKAARRLKIDYKTIHNKIKTYQIITKEV